jgi:hypothetical protein
VLLYHQDDQVAIPRFPFGNNITYGKPFLVPDIPEQVICGYWGGEEGKKYHGSQLQPTTGNWQLATQLTPAN